MSVKVNFSLAKMARQTPRIMAQLLNEVGALVITDTIKGAQRGVDQSNRPFKPLKPATIRRKTGQFPSRALWDTGRMLEGMFLRKVATASRLRALVGLARDREKIGGFHQTGDGNPLRVWFPEKATPRISKAMRPLLRSTAAKIVKSIK